MDRINYGNRFAHIEAIFFDFGGTLYELDDSVINAWKDILLKYGISFDESCFFYALNVARSYLDRQSAKKVRLGKNSDIPFTNWVYYHSLMLRIMGVKGKFLLNNLSIEITKSMNNIENRYKIKKDAKEVLIFLKQNYKLGLISNTTLDCRRSLNEDGILYLFDVIGLSYEIGFWKPDKKIFMECCSRAKLLPQNCVYVGDSQICDYNGALNAGMIPILINNKNTSKNCFSIDDLWSSHPIDDDRKECSFNEFKRDKKIVGNVARPNISDLPEIFKLISEEII